MPRLRDACILVLGGTGLVGSQIVRAIGHQLDPKKIIIASLYEQEVRDFLAVIRKELPDVAFTGAWGNVFVRDELVKASRGGLMESAKKREMLYEDLFGDIYKAYDRSAVVQLVKMHQPDVVIDCINTATGISYQDVESISKKTHNALRELKAWKADPEAETLDEVLEPLEQHVSTLLISQATSQLIRHVRLLNQALREVGTRLYLKIGTTGTGGMGMNIPYTHSEDKPSVQLMTKTAMAFAHTGLMFLMARTPGGPLVKEIKPGGLIGYRKVNYQTIKRRGEVQYRYESRIDPIGDTLRLHETPDTYERLEELQMAGVDTGENGFFARGEFEAITYIDQMEFLTPEEIASQVVLEIKGSNTGHDVIAGVDSNVMDPSYRGGVLRHTALDNLTHLEGATQSHSVALGQLGPPELSKLLYESYLLKRTYWTLNAVMEASDEELSRILFRFIQQEHDIRQTIISIGVPILVPEGDRLIRGPRINIPESIYGEVPMHPADVDVWARKGWVDLRPANMRRWQDRFDRMRKAQHQLHGPGTGSITRTTYLTKTIEIGAVVAWIFANEEGGYRIK